MKDWKTVDAILDGELTVEDEVEKLRSELAHPKENEDMVRFYRRKLEELVEERRKTRGTSTR